MVAVGSEKDSTELRLMGRDELNIAEFPIAVLSPQATDEKSINCRRQILLPNGQHLDQEWEVTTAGKHTLPLPGDQDVLLALVKIATDAAQPEPKVYFSRYEVIQLLGWYPNARSNHRLEEAVQRYWAVRIRTRNSFWNKQKKEWASHSGLSIIDAFEFVERPTRGSEPRDTRRLNWVQFGQQFFESLTAGYVKPLDLTVYLSLKLSVAKRLYRYLDKHRYRRGTHSIALNTLASAHIGFSESITMRPATIKRALESAHEELREHRFLRNVAYTQQKDGSWKVVYTFHSGRTEAEQLGLPEVDPPRSPLVEALISRGVSPRNAEELVASKPAGFIETQLDVFDHLMQLGAKKPIDNPAGFLTKAIRDDWKLSPPGYVSREERELRAQKRLQAIEVRKVETAREEQHQQSLQQLRTQLPAELLDTLRTQALEEARRQFGNMKLRDSSPIVEAFLNGLIEEKYLSNSDRLPQ